MSEFKNIFNAGIEDGLDKNAILMKLITEGGLDVQSAIREYNTLAREAGLTMTKEQRFEKIGEILGESDLSTKDGCDAAKEDLMSELDIAPSTSSSYLRDYAQSNDIELPTSQRASIANKVDVVAYLVDHRGDKKSELSKGLMDEFGYKKGTSDTITSMIGYMEEYAKQLAEADDTAGEAA